MSVWFVPLFAESSIKAWLGHNLTIQDAQAYVSARIAPAIACKLESCFRDVPLSHIMTPQERQHFCIRRVCAWSSSLFLIVFFMHAPFTSIRLSIRPSFLRPLSLDSSLCRLLHPSLISRSVPCSLARLHGASEIQGCAY